MPRPNIDRDDLVHMLEEVITSEGYEIDSEIEKELFKLAKLILAKHSTDDEEEVEEEEDLFSDMFESMDDDDTGWSDEEE